MEHRKASIEQWALHFLLNDSEMRDSFTKARLGWEEELKTHPDPQLESLCCKFNPDNYQVDNFQMDLGSRHVAPPEFLRNTKAFRGE